jgi:FtsP/CotA-like multicopper oxidase with cupredoxin domain
MLEMFDSIVLIKKQIEKLAMTGATRSALPATLALMGMILSGSVAAQSFRVQCPGDGKVPYTNLHPDPSAPATIALVAAAGSGATYQSVFPGDIKCQQIAGTDGYATMGDGTQIYVFGFGPLSGLTDLTNGLPGTQTAANFNKTYTGPFRVDDPSLYTVAALQDPTTIGKTAAGFNAGMLETATMMNMGILAAQTPAPLMVIDEDDELFLTLTNTGQIMRPDLFEQHTVHFHGYPNASSYFDGVPDASVAINIAGSFTYYYTAPDAGTYFWHCHITPPEHLQMGMVGQLYVRPRQNRVNGDLGLALLAANKKAAVDSSASGKSCSDILCTGQTPLPANAGSDGATSQTNDGTRKYAYNDGDGSTAYDVEVPLQMMGFDPNFHYVGMTFNSESFADMKDKYFLLNGRGYPDTVSNGPIATLGADGASRVSQPLNAKIVINKSTGQKRALLRISMLSVTEHVTLATAGVPMTVIAQNARLLRDMAGNNMYYDTNSITMGGGESTDVILDVSNVPTGTYYLYSTNLDHLSNDAENFGGMMTEIQVL